MALQSPGVQVTVVNESYYTTNTQGTVPLFVVATAQNKNNSSGTGIAAGTLKANAESVYTVASQRELSDYFGTPKFKTAIDGSPIHGAEQNEYGLQAAYSFLGVSNPAYIVRADLNLNELTAQDKAPGSEPANGQWWLDTASTQWGIFEWDSTPVRLNGQKFVHKVPTVINDTDVDMLDDVGGVMYPKASVGKSGDYAVVSASDVIRYFYKGTDYTTSGNPISWQLIGTKQWRKFWPTFVSAGYNPPTSGDISITINGRLVTVPNNSTLNDVVTLINSLVITGVKAANIGGNLNLFVTDKTDDVGDSTDSILILMEDSTVGSVAALFDVPAGEYFGPELTIAPHTSVPQWKAGDSYPRPSGSVWVKSTDPNLGARYRIKKYNSSTKAWAEVRTGLNATPQAAIYALDRTGGGVNIPVDQVFVQYNYSEDTGYDNTPQTTSFKIFVRKNAGVNATSITSDAVTNQLSAGSKTIFIRESLKGSPTLGPVTQINFTAAGNSADANAIAVAINSSSLTNIRASVASGRLTIVHTLGGEFRITDTSGALAAIGFTTFNYEDGSGTPNLYAVPAGSVVDENDVEVLETFVASSWLPLAGSLTGYISAKNAPEAEASDGQLWYSNVVNEVDIMIHNGTTWVGYLDSTSPYYKGSSSQQTDPSGPIVSATRPLLQSDGTVLVTGDIWIDTSDLENYPVIYRFNNDLSDTPVANRWVLIDNTDHTSENGVLFADARAGTTGGDATTAPSGTIKELLVSNFVDFDAPDPALYPRGMMLWNTRRSGFNVKVYRHTYVDTTADNIRFNDESMALYHRSRWVTESADKFGRHAQRHVVVTALKKVIATSQQLRETEVRQFNLLACPGYPEVLQNLIDLNADRGDTAFIVGDSPFRLPADSTSLTSWGTNAKGAADNDENSLVSYDAYTAVFYPSGLTTDNVGNSVVVPASHMMLKTMAVSDQVSYPWFAPAGIRRGAITNATSVGYIDKTTGSFKTVALTEGQRDTLYNVGVNPLTYFNGVGLVNYGQKTRANTASALDRINVARLVIYLRTQLNKLAKPYVFEPNDKITRDEIKQAVESLLLELVGLRALYDYAVVCDETNNTPDRIDRNELYVDIAIEPVKAIEFIYIPLRLKNTGEIQQSSTR
jgi:hypothetical protein